MHLDHFARLILDICSPLLVQPLLFLYYLPSFLHKTSWEKVLCSQMVLVTNLHEETHQLAHRMIRDHKLQADLVIYT